ncbi:MAG TPA: hypothetical protein PLV92_03700 [Pirellulaceae bacterium]|nr:hypothetical protein [Pirellulaceae bacterium]
MNRHSLRRVIVIVACGLLVAAPLVSSRGQGKGPKTVDRAAPPKYTASDTKGVFFENIFDGKTLVGERPANLSAAGPAGGGRPGGSAGGGAVAGGGGGSPGGGGSGTWSKVIASNEIEDEIKSIKQMVDKYVTTPTEFAGKGYKEARRDFSVLAMLFAIIGEYDGEVRWKGDAAFVRDTFARTAANAKVGTQQVYNEAKARKQDLTDLLGGGGLANKGNAEAKVNWDQTCDRSPLMQRLEAALEPRLQQWTANKGEFNAKKEQILHEAQIMAAIGRVLMQEGMSDADADDYKGFCKVLEKAATDVADAVKLGADEPARQAVGAISKSCNDCHEKYR